MYEYQIVAVDINKSYSNITNAVQALDNSLSDNAAPEEATNLQATPGNQFVFLEWDASVNSAQDQIDQRLDVSTDGGVTWGSNAPEFNNGETLSLGLATSSYLASGLTNNTNYLFRLRTQDSAAPTNTSNGVQTGIVTPSETAYTTISSNITEDTVWEAGVYVLNTNIRIDDGVTLTINPGVIVKFTSGRRLDIRVSYSPMVWYLPLLVMMNMVVTTSGWSVYRQPRRSVLYALLSSCRRTSLS